MDALRELKLAVRNDFEEHFPSLLHVAYASYPYHPQSCCGEFGVHFVCLAEYTSNCSSFPE